jgi:ComF family protein
MSGTTHAGDNRVMSRPKLHTRFRKFMRGVSIRIDTAIMPRRCVFCGTRCHDDEPLVCTGCYGDLPWNDLCCRRCAQPIGSAQPQDVDCADCQVDPPPVQAMVAPLVYTFPVDAAIKAMKFHRKLFYAPVFGEVLVRAFGRLPAGIDAILPVPLHWRRHAMRGYNQARELCKPLLRQTGLPLVTNIVRQRPTVYQSGLDARARRRNLRRAFSVRGNLVGQHVLIVDDVITSGATCHALARTLLQAGVDKVSVLALARAAHD